MPEFFLFFFPGGRGPPSGKIKPPIWRSSPIFWPELVPCSSESSPCLLISVLKLQVQYMKIEKYKEKSCEYILNSVFNINTPHFCMVKMSSPPPSELRMFPIFPPPFSTVWGQQFVPKMPSLDPTKNLEKKPCMWKTKSWPPCTFWNIFFYLK